VFLKSISFSNTLHDEYIPLCVCDSISLLRRCVPDPSYLIADRLPIVRKFLDIIDLDDAFRKILTDIYVAWREILALCGIAVGKHLHIHMNMIIIYQ